VVPCGVFVRETSTFRYYCHNSRERIPSYHELNCENERKEAIILIAGKGKRHREERRRSDPLLGEAK